MPRDTTILEIAYGSKPGELIFFVRPAFSQAEHWGFLFADLIQHVAQMYNTTSGEDTEETSQIILKMINDKKIQMSAKEAIAPIESSGLFALGKAVEE
jgi:hypothetical protein